MSSFIRNKLQDLILVGSPRVGFHPAIPYHRQSLHPLIKEHAQYVSYDNAIVNGLIICKICRQIFTQARWNKKFILKHFQQNHHLPSSENQTSPPTREPIVDKVQPNETKEALPKLEKAQANITPDPIEPISPKVAESIEASAPVPMSSSLLMMIFQQVFKLKFLIRFLLSKRNVTGNQRLDRIWLHFPLKRKEKRSENTLRKMGWVRRELGKRKY